MGWKDLPGWLKWGLIWAAVGLILATLTRTLNLYGILIIVEIFLMGSLFGFILDTSWFKSRAYWLEGGIIYLLILIGFFIVDKSLCYNELCMSGNPLYDITIAIWVLSMLIFAPFMLFDVFFEGIHITEKPILMLIFLFVVGSLIGWIVGKIKHKKKL